MQLVSKDTFDFRICLTMICFVFFKESRSIVFKIENFEVHPCTSAFLPVFIRPSFCIVFTRFLFVTFSTLLCVFAWWLISFLAYVFVVPQVLHFFLSDTPPPPRPPPFNGINSHVGHVFSECSDLFLLFDFLYCILVILLCSLQPPSRLVTPYLSTCD